ncbi:MAG: class I SAM-dependent methyltransferase [Lachnospiraceae bacterium]|nr:class I SAM-dependent methyltransferase [Lachnospiraceae bacterium]
MAAIVNETHTEKRIEPVTEQEACISDYIRLNAGGEDYSELTRNDNRFFVQYHFNDYRSSILRWYPFRENSRVLEIGAEFGALTGALCDRTAEVISVVDSRFQARMLKERYSGRDNLTIAVSGLDEFEEDDVYDYIICFSKLEHADDPCSFLSGLRRHLKKDGIILLEAENKYGIDNLCGKRDSHSGSPFESLAGYPDRRLGKGFHRQELIDTIKKAGYSGYRFYYPVPDHIAPHAIYTDDYQPEQNMGERLVTYDADPSTLVADTRAFFLEASANGVFSFVANSFLVEISDADIKTDIDYITLTGYRSRKCAFATMICRDETVRKRCLYPDGSEYAKGLCEKADMLKSRGINVLGMKLEKDTLLMDRIKAPTFQQHIAGIAADKCGKDELFRMYDLMWGNILKSSDPGGECSFDNRGMDLGPVLKDAFLELIPLNSFWINDDILYFDQEYVRHDYPAKYIMFRCIIHSYGQIGDLKSIVPRKDMYDHFGIDPNMAGLFTEIESALSRDENPGMFFLPQGRNEEQMKRNRESLGKSDGR